jgi:hypothetical protein
LNRNLLVFSLLLIFAGAGTGFYLIALFGLLLLIPALMSPTRVPTRPTPAPTPTKYQPRRIMPPPVKQPEPAMQAPSASSMAVPAPAQMAAYMAAPSSESSGMSYTPPLFPTSLFPSLSGMSGAQPPTPRGPEHPKPRGEDDLLEVGALLVLLRLFSA